MFSLFRVAAAAPKVKVADVAFLQEQMIQLMDEARKNLASLLVFPELSLSSYTCGDLFFQTPLLSQCQTALAQLLEHSKGSDMITVVGMPLAVKNALYNCAVFLQDGILLGVVPKTHIPNYQEFYEKRWFASGTQCQETSVLLCGQTVPFGTDLLFTDAAHPELTIGAEICEDLWAPIPPSSYQALQGATVLVNLSASNELATKPGYRRQLVTHQSASTVSAYVYASAALGESTQDTVFSGHCLIAENGTLLAESQRFQQENQLLLADVDLELLANDRRKNTSFSQPEQTLPPARYISFSQAETTPDVCLRTVSPHPFIPKEDQNLQSRCEDIFRIQVAGLAKRFLHTRAKTMVLGISGGLDSTLALLVAAKACDFIGVDRSVILGVTMPGFGTTDRTYQNALALMDALGVTKREISIADAALQHFKDIGHDPDIHDVTYENTQARERTQILMDLANCNGGFVIGTGDLSELALGWATYNGDHMSMYGVNAGVPKTLVRVLVRHVAQSGTLSAEAARVLEDVLDTPVSPELLPPDTDGNIQQKTEDIVGPYELHDFFLYYVVRFGFSPAKILYLAQLAFAGQYDRQTLLKWLKNFYRRFFQQQFKRSCLPDGPKVGTISLSPRGDWRMPSDAESTLWLAQLETLE